jgi:hypothetical protein
VARGTLLVIEQILRHGSLDTLDKTAAGVGWNFAR